jgi:hypothetical protein
MHFVVSQYRIAAREVCVKSCSPSDADKEPVSEESEAVACVILEHRADGQRVVAPGITQRTVFPEVTTSDISLLSTDAASIAERST